MNRLLLFILASCLLTGCRSSRTASSSMEQHLTSSVVQTSDSVGLSLSRQMQRMLGEGTFSARIIRFYPSADSLPPVIIPDSPLPASSDFSLPSDNHYQPEAPSSHLGPMPWLLPFGQISSITDIQFNGLVLQESESGSASMVQESDATSVDINARLTEKESTEVKPVRYPWYKHLILFAFVALVLGTIASILSRCRIGRDQN